MAQKLKEDKIGSLSQPYGHIYRVVNTLNNKCYIGQTVKSSQRRFIEHKTKNSSCHKLSRAMKKYGKDNFTLEILHSCSSFEELNQKEVEYILKYDSVENGYNIREGGVRGKLNKSSLEKMTKSQIKRFEGKITGIYQFDMQGNLVKKWRSEREILQKKGWKVGDCLTGKRHMRQGYIWLRENDPEQAREKASKCRPKRRKIEAYTSLETIFFSSVKEASIHFKCSSSLISMSVKNRTRSKGYYWRYV